jgi:23S rRNA (guanosine2251-2'-O)-methyltransferase
MSSQYFIFGIHAVEAALQKHSDRITSVCVAQERHDKKMEALVSLTKKLTIPLQTMARTELDKLTNSGNHQGILAYMQAAQTYSEQDLPILLEKITGPAFILILDGVQDPHNLGACFRSADAAGVHIIIAPKDKAVGITPVVSKVACGAAETIPFVQVTNLVRTLEMLKEQGIWIYGAAGEAEQSIYQTKFSGAIAIAMGAEGSGLRRLTREHCDVLVKIPMQGTVSSLNVSVATAVLLFEAVRQRIK